MEETIEKINAILSSSKKKEGSAEEMGSLLNKLQESLDTELERVNACLT